MSSRVQEAEPPVKREKRQHGASESSPRRTSPRGKSVKEATLLVSKGMKRPSVNQEKQAKEMQLKRHKVNFLYNTPKIWGII